MVVIRNGKFISRKKTSFDDKEEVHQMRSSGNYGYELKYNNKRIWPSFNVNYVEDTLSFHWDTVGGIGGIQGNAAIRDNSPCEETYEFDPNGGNGYVNIIDRETSLWHRPELEILVIGPNDVNGVQICTIDSIKLPGDNAGGDIHNAGSVTLQNNEDNDIDKIKKLYSDKFKDYNVPTNNIAINKYRITPTQPDEFYDSTGNYTDDYKYTPCYKDNEDFWLHFTLNPNNSSSNRYGMIIVSKIYTKIGETIDLVKFEDEKIKPVILTSWYQRPNILYYCHANWVDPNSVGVTEYSCKYNDFRPSVYLHIELGISPDGGNTIYWNDSLKENYSSLSLNSSVPNTLNKNAIVLEIVDGQDKDKFSSNYDVQVINSDSPDKIVKITLHPNYVNNEDNNKNYLSEEYFIGNTSDDYNNSPNPNNRKHNSDIVNIDGKSWAQAGYVSNLETNIDNPSSNVFNDVTTSFRVKRKRSTSNWNIGLKVKVNINKDTCPSDMTQEKYTTEK